MLKPVWLCHGVTNFCGKRIALGAAAGCFGLQIGPVLGTARLALLALQQAASPGLG
jgi:hypothetical protein